MEKKIVAELIADYTIKVLGIKMPPDTFIKINQYCRQCLATLMPQEEADVFLWDRITRDGSPELHKRLAKVYIDTIEKIHPGVLTNPKEAKEALASVMGNIKAESNFKIKE